jgi:hypothetical protein
MLTEADGDEQAPEALGGVSAAVCSVTMVGLVFTGICA